MRDDGEYRSPFVTNRMRKITRYIIALFLAFHVTNNNIVIVSVVTATGAAKSER